MASALLLRLERFRTATVYPFGGKALSSKEQVGDRPRDSQVSCWPRVA